MPPIARAVQQFGRTGDFKLTHYRAAAFTALGVSVLADRSDEDGRRLALLDELRRRFLPAS